MHDDEVVSELLAEVLATLGLWPAEITVMQEGPYGNCCWLVEPPSAEPVVLRRYHDAATPEDLAYEHAVMKHLAADGWVVPDPVGELIWFDRWWWVPTRLVPGEAIREETIEQRRRRGRSLARLHQSLRACSHLGQRPGWRAQHTATSIHENIDWDANLGAFATDHPDLAEWAAAAAAAARQRLRAVGADELPTLVVHGDFHELNVHYYEDGLAGVLDFGLTHLDSRPYELAIARTHRSPEVIDGFREESARCGWPLSDLEEACIEPIRTAFRVGMVAWELDHGRRVGRYNRRHIERQLNKAQVPRPESVVRQAH